MVTFTTTDLIGRIKSNTHVPQGNNTFSETQFLQIADMQMRTKVAPKIASCRENYWLTTQRTGINNDRNQYPLPSKSLGSAIVDVKVEVGTNLIHLSRIEASDLYSTQFTTRPAYCYMIEDFIMKLYPQSLTGTLVMWYYRIPSQLTGTENCAQISSISGNTVTVDSVPSTFGTLPELDIVSQQPGFNVLLKDDEPVTIAGNDIEFTSLPFTVAVGDWVCLSGQSCVVQCPLEWVEYLVQACSLQIYEIQGYLNKHKVAMDTLKDMETQLMGLVSPRTIENAKVVSGGGSLLQPQTIGWKLPVRG